MQILSELDANPNLNSIVFFFLFKNKRQQGLYKILLMKRVLTHWRNPSIQQEVNEHKEIIVILNKE